MPAPKNNKFAAKPPEARVDARAVIRGTHSERAAWRKAHALAGTGWNTWGRKALNLAARKKP